MFAKILASAWLRPRRLLATIVVVGLTGCGEGTSSSTSNTASLSIRNVGPTQVSVGDNVVIRGDGFEDGMAVLINDTPVTYTLTNSTELVARVVPALSSDAIVPLNIVVKRQDGRSTQWLSGGDHESVLLPVPEVTSVPTGALKQGATVSLTGVRLNLVSKVCIESSCDAQPQIAADGRSLTFTATGGTSGTVVLTDLYGKTHTAGTVVVSPSASSLQLADVQLAQAHLLSVLASPSPYARWVGARPLLVRAKVLAPEAQRAATVTLSVGNGTSVQTFEMIGPGNVPTTLPAADDLANTWTYEIPAYLVRTGMTLALTVQDKNIFRSPRLNWSYSPNVSRKLFARLVLIPLQTPKLERFPANYPWGSIRKYVQSVFPVSKFRVVLADPLVADNGDNSGAWLAAVNTRRSLEKAPPTDFYGGIGPFGVWVRGLAYVPGRAFVTPYDFYGWEAAAESYLPHELGHNFGRPHSFSDPLFPYPGERMGGDWGIHLNYNRALRDPSKWYDIMSYGFPAATSAYTFYNAHTYALGQLPSTRPSNWLTAGADAASDSLADMVAPDDSPAGIVLPDQPVLHILGEYNAARNTATWQPASQNESLPDLQASATFYEANRNSKLVLRLTLNNRSVRWYALPLAEIAHHPDGNVQSFSATIPFVNDIRNVSLLASGKIVYNKDFALPAIDGSEPYSMKRESGGVRLRWNTQRYPYLSVVLKREGNLRALLINSTKGDVLLPNLSAGTLTLHFSDGANTRMFAEGL